MRELREIDVALIREGDEFLSTDGSTNYWTAAQDAQHVGNEIHLNVRFVDGGSGTRVWDRGTKLEIVRDGFPDEDVILGPGDGTTWLGGQTRNFK